MIEYIGFAVHFVCFAYCTVSHQPFDTQRRDEESLREEFGQLRAEVGKMRKDWAFACNRQQAVGSQ